MAKRKRPAKAKARKQPEPKPARGWTTPRAADLAALFDVSPEEVWTRRSDGRATKTALEEHLQALHGRGELLPGVLLRHAAGHNRPWFPGEEWLAECPALSPPKKRAFLAAYAVCGVRSRAAEAAGVSVRTVQRWLAETDEEGEPADPAFREWVERARQISLDVLVAAARHRAVRGVCRVKYHQGRPCGLEWELDTTLLIFLVKGGLPEYRDRGRPASGDPGVNVTVPVEVEVGLCEELRDGLAEALREAPIPGAGVPTGPAARRSGGEEEPIHGGAATR